MQTKIQLIALYTILRREVVRMLRISSQVFLPPVIITSLYFLIFGALIGERIGTIDGVDYVTFITPGLIMMTVITNAYGNVSSSLYSTRFQKNIEEMLVSPMHDSLILVGFVLGGVIRGFIVALLVFGVSCFFLPSLSIHHLPMTLLIVLMVSALFSLAGFTNAMLARNFDDIMLVPTFLLTPLTYLGGVFYSTQMLPPFWEKISLCNPVLYMINAMRHSMLGIENINMGLSILVIALSLALLTGLNLYLLKKGVGLRD